MGKKKHKKKRKNKKVQPDTVILDGAPYPVIGMPHFNYSWGLSSLLSPWNTPFLDRLPVARPPSDPLTEQDVDAAQQAAEEIVRKHTK